nr:FecR domain-containing protein [Candidatus Saccharicenans sp.]
MRRNKLLILASIILLLSWPTFLKAQSKSEQPAEETRYTNESIGRVTLVEGKSFIQRAAEVGYEEVVVNDPIAEGDRIETAEGRLEILFGQRNYLRLDTETKIDVLSLPKRDSELTRFRIWSGHAYLEVNRLNEEKNIEIHTPDSSFYILEKGVYRLDVDGNKGTEIRVFKGVAEAAGEQDSYLVKSAQRLEMAQGRF